MGPWLLTCRRAYDLGVKQSMRWSRQRLVSHGQGRKSTEQAGGHVRQTRDQGRDGRGVGLHLDVVHSSANSLHSVQWSGRWAGGRSHRTMDGTQTEDRALGAGAGVGGSHK